MNTTLLEKKTCKEERIDPFNNMDIQDVSSLESILLNRINSTYYKKVLKWFFENLKLNGQPRKVLEVGCGTGHVLNFCKENYGKTITDIYGVDLSEEIIKNAKKRFPEFNLRVADGNSLPFEDNMFDLTYASTVLVHAHNPFNIIKEMKRITASNGIIAILDQDFESAVLYPGEKELTRRVLNSIADYWNDGWIGRKLPDLLNKAGLFDIKIEAYVRIDRVFDEEFFKRIKDWIIKDGFNVEEANLWFNELRRNADANNFLFTRNFYCATGRR